MKKRSILNKLWSLAYPPLIYMTLQVIVGVTFFISYVLFSNLNFSAMSKNEINDYLIKTAVAIGIPSLLVACIIALPLFAFFFKSDKPAYPENHQRFNFSLYLIFLLIGAFSNIYCSGMIEITKLQSFFPVTNNILDLMIVPQNVLINSLTIGILVPIIEELCFRGLVFKRARHYFGVTPSIILSALLFGIIHGNMLQFIYATLLGVLLAMIYQKCGKISAPILIHIGFNLFSVLFSGFEFFSFLVFVLSAVALFFLCYITLFKIPFFTFKSNL